MEYLPSSKRESNQLWDAIVIMKAAYTEVPWIPLFHGIPSRWSGLSSPHSRAPCIVAILDGRIFALLVCGHVWLESGAGMLCIRWDLESEAQR